MKTILLFLVSCLLIGSSYSQESVFSSRLPEEVKIAESNNTYVIENFIRFNDNMDGDNTVPGLEARGYVAFRGPNAGPAGTTFWFQGNPATFVAYNGPDNGYVGANFNATTGANNIDNWLVLPATHTLSGDSLTFFSRSTTSPTWVDSIRVMYSQSGSTTAGGDWVELGRFMVNNNGVWERRSYAAPVGGVNSRFAIRYCVVNGGPSGNNSDYIGIDQISIHGVNDIPVELASFSAFQSGYDVMLNWSTASETNNKGFAVERRFQGEETWNEISFVNGHGTTTELQSYNYQDKLNNLNINGTISYRLRQVDFDGTYEYSSVVNVDFNNLPENFGLQQNYPNPFNPSTKINYSIASAVFVNISVYNLLGEKVAELVNEMKEAGNYEVNFDASQLTSGIYLYKLEAGSFVQTNKMTLLR